MLKRNDPVSIEAKNNGAYAFNGKHYFLRSDSMSLKISGKDFNSFDFKPLEEYSYQLGNIKGKVKVDVSRESGIEIRRELFSADNGVIAALRFKVKNIGQSDIILDSLNPLEVLNNESFTVADGRMDKWKMLRYPFHKSDIPSYFKPTVVNKGFEDAVFSCINAVPGQGVIYNSLNSESRTVSSGPILIIRNDERENEPGFMLCTTGIEKHFLEMFLTTTDDRKELKEFKIECNFDGIVLSPGKEADMHWLLLATAENESALLDIYTETVAEMYALQPVKSPPPTVFCTWYFYTLNFNEKYLDDELAAIVERNIPLDVFQIDDGWMDNYGLFEADPEKFPNGMKAAADKIKKAGMTPGIWACPFVVEVDSPVLQKYPDLMQKDSEGDPIIYDTSLNNCYVLDPTGPGAIEYLTELLTKLKSWGYSYFKLDWLRAIYEFENVRFHDPSVNRAQAYSIAMKAIREILGPDSYICACGGLSDPGNFGTVNALRTCKDVRGIWCGPKEIGKSGALIHIKQNVLRNYINRFYHSDPDGTQIRIRKERFFENERKCVGVYQSEGHYTDEEAFTVVAQQYVCGGLVMISERLPELQETRLDLLKKIAPSCGVNPAEILDFDAPDCPSMFLSKVTPQCGTLGKWWLFSVGNWEDETVKRKIALNHIPDAIKRFAVFEIYTQQFMGLFSRDEVVELLIPAHGTRVLRICPWDGLSPKILGTDLHITGGSEISGFKPEKAKLSGKVETPWQCPVTITAGFPDSDGIKIISKTFDSNENFILSL